MAEEIQNTETISDNIPENNELKWYLVHTLSAREGKVQQFLKNKVENLKLQDLITEIVVPTEPVTVEVTKKLKDGTTKVEQRTRERKLFPSYVFVKMVMNKDTWFVVRNVSGVTNFCGADPQHPAPLTPEEVRRWRLEVDEVADAQFISAFNVGDAINVIGGPLKGNSGIVASINLEKKCIKAKVSMFGREIDAELAYSEVEKQE